MTVNELPAVNASLNGLASTVLAKAEALAKEMIAKSPKLLKK